MRTIGRVILALGLVVGSVMPALASPAGEWELDTRDTRFNLQMCGDGSQLCGTLSWLSDADYNTKYLPYLNTPVVKQLKQVGANKWKGEMQLFGQKVSGTITQNSEDQLTLSGCAFLIVCKSYKMFRHQ